MEDPQKKSASGPDSCRIFKKLVADLIDGLIPGEARPGAVYQLHGILHAPVAEAVAPGRGPLGAVGAEIEGRIVIRLLADPYAVLQLGDDAASDGAVGADRPPVFRLQPGLGKFLFSSVVACRMQDSGSSPIRAPLPSAAPLTFMKRPPGDVFRGGGFGGYPLQPFFIDLFHGSITSITMQSMRYSLAVS